MLKLIYVFLGYCLIKLLINYSKYYECKQYLDKYLKWVLNPDFKLSEHKSHVIKLFKDAGLENSTIQRGNVATGDVWVFEQFSSYADDEVVEKTREYFHQAIGVYRSRALEVFNPIYWIEFIIYLPKNIINYLGGPPESIITKIIQLIYWLGSIFYALEWLSKIIS